MKLFIPLITLLMIFVIPAISMTQVTVEEPFKGLQAVYIRPTPLTMESATQFMADMKSWGADEVFLEAGYDNSVLNHSEIFPPMDEENDWMKILVDEAKRQGLKVHIWMKAGFWVHKKENIQEFPILRDHSEWIDLNREGNMVSNAGSYEEQHFIFVNLAIPEVRKALKDYVKEVAAYDIDGISLDYIRFKTARSDFNTWYGYNPYSVEQFKKKTGIDPLTIKYDLSSGSDFMKWTKYNEEVIAGCVEEIRSCIDEINETSGKNIILSSSPFTGYESGKSPKFQNWRIWDNRGYIDLWLPMCMSISMDALEDEIEGVKELGLQAPYYPVVYPGQHGSLHPPMKPHHKVLMKTGIDKFAVFSYKQLKQEMPEAEVLVKKENAFPPKKMIDKKVGQESEGVKDAENYLNRLDDLLEEEGE